MEYEIIPRYIETSCAHKRSSWGSIRLVTINGVFMNINTEIITKTDLTKRCCCILSIFSLDIVFTRLLQDKIVYRIAEKRWATLKQLLWIRERNIEILSLWLVDFRDIVLSKKKPQTSALPTAGEDITAENTSRWPKELRGYCGSYKESQICWINN